MELSPLSFAKSLEHRQNRLNACFGAEAAAGWKKQNIFLHWSAVTLVGAASAKMALLVLTLKC